MPTFLVTGGAGFIGLHLVEYLLKLGYKVKIIDNFSTSSPENLSHIKAAEVIVGDIRDKETVKEAMEGGVDYILHHAALSSVEKSILDPEETHQVNVVGTLNLLQQARLKNIKRFVYASSAAVYGDTAADKNIKVNERSHLHPLSPYAVSKLAAEQYCQVFAHQRGLETVALRYFNVYGPRQSSAVIPSFIKALLKSEPPVIFGDGEQSRDFIYIADVVQANLLACFSEQVSGKVFNIASGKSISIQELFFIIRELMLPLNTAAANIKPIYKPAKDGEVRHSLADTKRANEILGFEPKTDLRAGLQATIDWFINHAAEALS